MPLIYTFFHEKNSIPKEWSEEKKSIARQATRHMAMYNNMGYSVSFRNMHLEKADKLAHQLTHML